MTTLDAKFRQAAWTYLVYGVVYWLGGLILAAHGLGPRGVARGGVTWFGAGAVLVVVIPWLLWRERAWLDRWILSRRDFGRVLTVLVALRAVEVARIAQAPRADTASLLGAPVSIRAGAWLFFVITIVTAVMLGRAAWSRES